MRAGCPAASREPPGCNPRPAARGRSAVARLRARPRVGRATVGRHRACQADPCASGVRHRPDGARVPGPVGVPAGQPLRARAVRVEADLPAALTADLVHPYPTRRYHPQHRSKSTGNVSLENRTGPRVPGPGPGPPVSGRRPPRAGGAARAEVTPNGAAAPDAGAGGNPPNFDSPLIKVRTVSICKCRLSKGTAGYRARPERTPLSPVRCCFDGIYAERCSFDD